MIQRRAQHQIGPAARASVFAVILMGLLAGLSGCTAWATYPPIPGAAQIGRPEFEPVPTIMAEAIRFVHERHSGELAVDDEQIVFNLPEGCPPNTYERVAQRLGAGEDSRASRWMTEEDEVAIHITSVRIRATEAQVDVVYPRPDGHYELVMLSMKQRFLNHYEIEGSRLWRVQVTAPPPHYYPPGMRDAYFGEDGELAEEGAADDAAQPDAHAGAISDEP